MKEQKISARESPNFPFKGKFTRKQERILKRQETKQQRKKTKKREKEKRKEKNTTLFCRVLQFSRKS